MSLELAFEKCECGAPEERRAYASAHALWCPSLRYLPPMTEAEASSARMRAYHLRLDGGTRWPP